MSEQEICGLRATLCPTCGDSCAATIATLLRQRAEELRDSAFNGRPPRLDVADVNVAAARELEAAALKIDGDQTYEESSVEFLTRELASSRERESQANDRIVVLRTAVDGLQIAGAPMSNLCYNWSQSGGSVSDADKPGLKRMQERWDTANGSATKALETLDREVRFEGETHETVAEHAAAKGEDEG